MPDTTILVTYASKHGATAEIAQVIGGALQRAGLHVTVVPMTAVSDITACDAVVLGSAIYAGRWRKEAIRFLGKHAVALASKPVWLFVSGPTGTGDPMDLVDNRPYPHTLDPVIAQIKPRDIAVFHGNIDVATLNTFERWIIQRVKAPTGDFRDWDAITAWADTIAAHLPSAAVELHRPAEVMTVGQS